MDNINDIESVHINDIECREPREVEPLHMQRTVVPSITPAEGRQFKTVLLSIGVGGCLVIMGFIIYMAVG